MIEPQGLAGWVLNCFQHWRQDLHRAPRRMHLVETLALGGKRQLLLIECDGERFLVGGGVDSVEVITPLLREGSPSMQNVRMNQPCA